MLFFTNPISPSTFAVTFGMLPGFGNVTLQITHLSVETTLYTRVFINPSWPYSRACFNNTSLSTFVRGYRSSCTSVRGYRTTCTFVRGQRLS